MEMIVVDDMRGGYISTAWTVLRNGRRASPRGVATREITGATIVIPSVSVSECLLPLGINRGVSRGIAAAEALQLVGGRSYPELMVQLSPNFAQFRDGGVFHGAYGPRLRPQMQSVLTKLREDRSTRQAVVTIWDPLQDGQGGRADIPCTVTMQFMLRDGLEMHLYMRSNDVWWGLAYDVFQFTFLQQVLAEALGTHAGKYVHHVGSLHVYERDIAKIESLRVIPDSFESPPVPRGLGADGEWESVAYIADAILRDPAGGEPWWSVALGKTRG